MDRAVEIAARGPEWGPNPRVGCVIVSRDGAIVGEGFHRGAGTPHAEVDALGDAAARGNDADGATAYVTLEPCAHVGRTGACTDALSGAGIAQVVYAVADPNPQAAGGASVLRERGIVANCEPHAGALALNARWLRAVVTGRPYVIAKWAATLDGRVAAADGTSIWITGDQARDHAHHVRASVGAMVVGTGTVLTDNPQLSARPAGAVDPHQPLRVVMGLRDTAGAQVWRDGNAVAVPTHDPVSVLAELSARDIRTVLIEGGPTVTTAFLRAGLVDEVHAYIAPILLGAGPAAVGDLGIGTMANVLRGVDVTVTPLGEDIVVTALLTGGT